MTDRRLLERRLEELREELGRVEGGPTEVYSRIVGYYRSVRNWNAGKREEYAARRNFAVPAAASGAMAPRPSGARIAGASRGEDVSGVARRTAEAATPGVDLGELLVFTRKACPNCPPVANYVRGSGLLAAFVDADGEEGSELARRHGVLATPTVIGLDARGRELFRACDLKSVQAALPARGSAGAARARAERAAG